MSKIDYPLTSKTMKETHSSLPNQTKEVSLFLEEIDIVCRKHGMSISHEDRHGAFVIENYNKSRCDWLFAASNKITGPVIKKLHISGISGEFADKDKTLEKQPMTNPINDVSEETQFIDKDEIINCSDAINELQKEYNIFYTQFLTETMWRQSGDVALQNTVNDLKVEIENLKKPWYIKLFKRV